jgi:hypothetical protein
VYIDLVGLAEAEATQRLLAGVRQVERPGRPQAAPVFPGVAAPARPDTLAVPPPFPGPGPWISNLAPRNPHFTGRDQLLEGLRELLGGGAAALVVVHGLGGVGKTQLALEYAHRHAEGYELVWWVPSETRLLATSGLAELALRLGLPARAEQAEQAAQALAELARRERWLLVFDNAEDPGDLEGLWPSGSGQVLVTSRNPQWGKLATPIKVGVLPHGEAVSFLLRRTNDPDEKVAGALAAELDKLPLALEQAAAYMDQTGLTLTGYRDLYRRHRDELLGKGSPAAHNATVDATFRLAFERVAKAMPAAAQLLKLCAFLAPEPIPPELLTADPWTVPPPLRKAARDEVVRNETVGVLIRYSLVERDQAGISLHRLVQAVVRHTLTPHERSQRRPLRLAEVSAPAAARAGGGGLE